MPYSWRPVRRSAKAARVARKTLPFATRLCTCVLVALWAIWALGFVSRSTLCASAAPLAVAGVEAEQRSEAIADIPLAHLTEEAQSKIAGVVSRPSIYRRMPVTVVESDPDLYLFLIRHPEVVVNMWDVMGVTKVTVARTGPFTFDAMDGAGTTCSVELLYGDRNVHVMYSEGHYEGPLLRNLIRGSCVLILKSDYSVTMDGGIHVTNRLDMFVRFENVGAELLARTLHPLVGRSADHNFIESTKFMGQVSDAAVNKLDRLHRFSQKLTKIDPQVRDQFNEVTSAAFARSYRRAYTARAAGEDGDANGANIDTR